MTSNGSPAIEVHGLTKRFSEVQAVAGVDFDVREGEIFGFLGPNGSGKTTTIHMLTGLARPDSGLIRYFGSEYTSDVKKAQRLMGIVPDELLAQPKVKVQAHLAYSTRHEAELQGALWYRFGFSPFATYAFSGGDVCMCEGPGFDVDPFGRVFFPNSGQFRVEVVDTHNNRIVDFGKYGNQDSRGGDAPVKKPPIPLAWPMTVAVSDTHAYVGDRINQRVVKVHLDYAAEEVCQVE